MNQKGDLNLHIFAIYFSAKHRLASHLHYKHYKTQDILALFQQERPQAPNYMELLAKYPSELDKKRRQWMSILRAQITF